MSIYKKMLIFSSVIIIVPMGIILFLSNTILDNQINQSAEEYLKEAFVIANNLLSSRMEEMGRLSANITESAGFDRELQNRDSESIYSFLNNTCKVYSYIDFYELYDADKNLIIGQPSIQNAGTERLDQLLKKAEKSQNAVTSVESFDLEDLFGRGTADYLKFRVYVNDQHEYLKKCLAAVSVHAIRNREGNGISGYLVLGAVLNNNSYLPMAYSNSVPNSYLALSTEGIRIASNITSPESENYTGSPMPVSVTTLEGTNNVYFGRKDFGGEVHIYLDRMITNVDGEDVGTIGVGIPEQKFKLISNTQKRINLFVPLFFLVIILFLLRYVAEKIARPIIKATGLANQISQGNTDVQIDISTLTDSNDESIILLRSLKMMADTLRKNKADILEYLKDLENGREEQQLLSQQLIALNETLEKKVEMRTQDLREAIEGLKRSGQYKSQFLANMSHELRTPLSSIISYSELLKAELFGPLNDKQKRYTDNILESSEQLQQLINSILDTAKIDAGKMTLAVGNCTLSEVIGESLSIVEILAYKKNITIENSMLGEDLIVRIDSRKTKQALCNILSNAIKFTPGGGQIRITSAQVESSVRIVIEDNGIGIKKEDQERVFSEFEQADNSYERKYEGTGLGLPLAKKFVEMQGGTIYLVSEINKGTKVAITLPININRGKADDPDIL
ncbi:ATP-binding protein [Clostridium sp. KNHs216]|uniref:HAMP domain-containing sensor histidine kinase n=1 Tax=Clostridium sp. KNHs216 TaxID=1550235 RepID=UPI00114F1114|nr:ATP-binding protein [Clostridium sp. KNHs216]TQI67863.1 signal transduction histidine kinase [Clostridium sp. KNHs216]